MQYTDNAFSPLPVCETGKPLASKMPQYTLFFFLLRRWCLPGGVKKAEELAKKAEEKNPADLVAIEAEEKHVKDLVHVSAVVRVANLRPEARVPCAGMPRVLRAGKKSASDWLTRLPPAVLPAASPADRVLSMSTS